MFEFSPSARLDAWLRALVGCVCLALSACSDGRVQCLGEPVACERRTVAQCAEGCAVVSGCQGEAVACDSLTSQGGPLCNQTPGCLWRVECAGVREETDSACQALTGEQCIRDADCLLSQACFGAGTACGSLASDQCELYDQCRLGATCGGRATDCGKMESVEACDEAPGCFAADTRSSAID